MELVLSINGKDTVLAPNKIAVERASEAGATIHAHGYINGLRIEVDTRVEYDGIAMSHLIITPDRPTNVDYIEFRTPVVLSPSMQLMRWDVAAYRKLIRSLQVSKPQFNGSFQHVVALADGSKSFWWFTDDANQWISNPRNSTHILVNGQSIMIVQRMYIGQVQPLTPVDIKFNWLATPVRESTSWRDRSHRIARRVSSEEGEIAGLHLWWPEAFPHQALPYSEWPAEITQVVPDTDKHFYLGAKNFRSQLEEARRMRITRLPYFSVHAPSLYDPQVVANRNQWEVVPPFVIRPGSDAPFKSRIERPWLSLRGPGLQEHLVERFGKVIDELNIEGLYFDQGAPINSENPAHGAWRDSSGHVHGTLDILAMRQYFKSLAELFFKKGKSGHLVVHMSSVPIIPAYTFVTGLAQGEEMLLSLKDLNYMESAPLNVVRTQYAPGQYGIGSIWLDQFWSPRVPGNPLARYTDLDQWLNSDEHRRVWRNYMALVLLHDATAWTFAPVQDRRDVFRIMDEFDIADALFLGYWENPVQTNEQDGMIASLYKRLDHSKALIVAANTSARTRPFIAGNLCSLISYKCPSILQMRVQGETSWKSISDDKIDLVIPARDFRLIEIRLPQLGNELPETSGRPAFATKNGPGVARTALAFH
jgi:hypothetical protein